MSNALLGTIVTKGKRFILPPEVIDIVKTYTGEAEWRNGKYVLIRRISRTDERYAMLKKRPLIKQIFHTDVDNNKRGCVWFKLDSGKFLVINVMIGSAFIGAQRYYGTFWEMHYNMNSETYILR
jgi:hypothetical protein